MKLALCSLGQDIANKINSKKLTRKRRFNANICKRSKPKKQVNNASKVYSRSLTEESIFSDQPSYVENWKGQGKITPLYPNTTIKFLRNGNLCPSFNSNLKVLNTCAFDSIMYLLGNEYNTNENFRTIVDAFHEKKMIPQYIKYLSDINSKDDDIYNLRTRIIVHYIENPTVPSENTYNVNF